MYTEDAKNAVEMVEVMEETGHLANQADHETTALQALKEHPWAVLWSVYAIWAIVNASFENQAGNIILGIPQFRQVH